MLNQKYITWLDEYIGIYQEQIVTALHAAGTMTTVQRQFRETENRKAAYYTGRMAGWYSEHAEALANIIGDLTEYQMNAAADEKEYTFLEILDAVDAIEKKNPCPPISQLNNYRYFLNNDK